MWAILYILSSLGSTKTDTPTTTRILPLNRLTFAPHVAGSTLQTMLVREMHLAAKQLEEARRTDIDARSCIAILARLAVDTNMRLLINLETH